MRAHQWYKNTVIFIAIFFTGNLLNLDAFSNVTIGFITLCIISSSNYVINDIFDVKEDRIHPEKKKRALASGKINKTTAIIFALILFAVGIFLADTLGNMFLISVVLLFILTLLYSMGLKNEPFLDIILIGVFFVIRAVSGALILNVSISPWLIICAFFLAIYIAIGKRYADIMFLGKDAIKHKKVLKYYTIDILNIMLATSLSTIIICYTLYTFIKVDQKLIITIPIIAYGLFRYLLLIKTESIVSRHPEKALLDLKLMGAIVLWGTIIFMFFYT